MLKSAQLNVMIAAVLKSAKGLQRDFGEVDQLQISRKGTSNFVTSSDLRTEKSLIRELKKARPEYGFLVEEAGEIPGKNPNMRWVIDPLDGTNNFIHAMPYFCVSVALEKRDGRGGSEILAGVIYDPMHNELFHAEKGEGAFLNDRRISVARRDKLDEMMLATAHHRHDRPAPQEHAGDLSDAFAQTGASTRAFGATALDLAHIAAGRVDGGWFSKFQPWDVAAGLLLIREAGGAATDFSGKPASIHSPSLLAASSTPHPTLLKLVAEHRRKRAAQA